MTLRALPRAVLNEHRPFLLVTSVFVATAGAGQLVLGRPYALRLTTATFAAMWGAMTATWLAFCWLRGPRHVRAALQPLRVAGALVVAAVTVPTQITFHVVKQRIGIVRGFAHDLTVSVALGWHYAVDGLVGVVCAWAAWTSARHVVRLCELAPAATSGTGSVTSRSLTQPALDDHDVLPNAVELGVLLVDPDLAKTEARTECP